MTTVELSGTLMSFPTEEHVQTVCKPGQGEGTCRYLTMGQNGWSCAKATRVQRTLDKRFADGAMNARGDNCEGLLAVIMEHQEELVGKKVEYQERMPTVNMSGVLRKIEVEDGNFRLATIFDGEEEEHTCLGTSVSDLEITVTPRRVSFTVAGMGAFVGITTVLLD